MNKHIFSAIGLSGLLLLGPAPTVLLAHEGDDHGDRQGGYSEQEESERYEPRREEDRGRYGREREESGRYEPQDEDDTYRPSSRRYPPPDDEYSSPRERRSREQ